MHNGTHDSLAHVVVVEDCFKRQYTTTQWLVHPRVAVPRQHRQSDIALLSHSTGQENRRSVALS